MMRRFITEVRSHRRDDIVDFESMAEAASLHQCVRDWFEGAGPDIISINGKLLRNIMIDSPEYSEFKGEETKRELTSNEKKERAKAIDAENGKRLQAVWSGHLLKGLDSGKRKAMLGHLSLLMHQGGYLDLLQTSLIVDAQKKDVTIPTSAVDRQTEIFVDKENKIHVKSTLKVKECFDSEGKSLAKNADGSPLMTVTGEVVLSLDKNNQPTHAVKSVTIEHNSEFTRSVFDNRSLLKQFIEGLENVSKAAYKVTKEVVTGVAKEVAKKIHISGSPPKPPEEPPPTPGLH